ncbi:T9SS type A sorting domain-containing protein [Persicitalea sp.]|uniref:T9SS type A sorting domain-containing protein n=1 Tax=Persicitalea sp. TaxID=3100273 RepID=UPI003593A2AF
MKKLSLFVLGCCLALTARATHLLGGEILAKNTSGLTYEITGILYLDLQNGGPAVNAQTDLIICLGDGLRLVAKRVSSEKLEGSPNVNRSVYRVVHTYAAAGKYTLTASLDNLTNGILNLDRLSPTKELPLVIKTILDTTSPNAVAQAPNPKFMSGLRQVFSLALPKTDPDGDSLSYRITRLLTQQQECQPTTLTNYVFPNEVTREGTFKIDRPAALLVWNAPTEIGLYAYAYVTEEWRNGVKVAETWRTYSLTITDQNSPTIVIPPFEPALADFNGVITALPPQEFLSAEISMKIFPVPSAESVTVEVSLRQPSAMHIEMVDLQGRILQQADFKDAASRCSLEFRTGDLAKGVYLIRVQSEDAVLMRKFVR